MQADGQGPYTCCGKSLKATVERSGYLTSYAEAEKVADTSFPCRVSSRTNSGKCSGI